MSEQQGLMGQQVRRVRQEPTEQQDPPEHLDRLDQQVRLARQELRESRALARRDRQVQTALLDPRERQAELALRVQRALAQQARQVLQDHKASTDSMVQRGPRELKALPDLQE